MNNIQIIDSPFSPWKELDDFCRTHLQNQVDSGANAVFVGSMRDFNEGDQVSAMTLECYPEMAQKQLGNLLADAHQQWPLNHVLVIHRVGMILPGEDIVLVATWSVHRKAAFESCRYIMEILKSTAPFWKKERLDTGDERWVEKNSAGY